jgi:hypothetical protein
MLLTGYTSPSYVASLAEYGRPVRLPKSGGFLLERNIPGTFEHDAMGPYPLFCCREWSSLPADFANLKGRVVTVVLVTDPFGRFDPVSLAPAFSHGLVRYKDHSVIDLEVPLDQTACQHHRRNARKALLGLTVEKITDPVQFVDTWCGLYAELIARHELTGISRLSREAFEAQLATPGLVAVRAIDHDCSTVGMVLWYCQRDVGYYHLAAYSPEGYAKKASYALFWASAELLRGRLRWLNLGAGAGVTSDGSDGLTRFKRGWSPLLRATYLGRHVVCSKRYAELCRGRPETDFFPAYRAPVDCLA